ncbi:MAG TPA: cupredoxin domain-containing protein [Candidatus Acidoferrales bacterium]|nr:cupredoxin domain-containing protein [Candidatus Acidoferrales bacterium]
MKPFLRAFLLSVFAAFLAAGAFSHQQQAPPQNQSAQVIDMTAKKYKFTPSPIHVKKGTKIQLRITATDRNHGFKINVYPDGAAANGAPGLVFTSPQDCWKLPKDQVVTIEFVAQTPGSYPFKCCVLCGFGHMGMKGELIVDE